MPAAPVLLKVSPQGQVTLRRAMRTALKNPSHFEAWIENGTLMLRPALAASPAEAASGASMSEILSPMPPVECLSAVGHGQGAKVTRSPDRIIASVRTAVSSGDMPRKKIAMASAAIW